MSVRERGESTPASGAGRRQMPEPDPGRASLNVSRRVALLGGAGVAVTSGLKMVELAAAPRAVGIDAAGMSATQDPHMAAGADFASRAGYDELEELVASFGLEHETNDERLLTWQGSYVNLSYVLMYQAHRDLAYLDRMIEHTDHVLASRDSERGVIDAYRGTSEPAWSAVRELEGLEARHLDASHTGMITYPMICFVRTVHETPALQRLEKYSTKAQEYLDAVQEAVAVHDIQYGETDEGFGYYRFLRGEHYDPDGIEYPHNKALAIGRVLLHLAATTGDQQYWDKTAGLARTFHSDLEVDAAGAYIWPYHWTESWGYQGWDEDDEVSDNRASFDGNRRIEDISHGALDVEFAVLAFRHNIVFDRQDMDRFARTFTQNLVRPAADGGYEVWYNVDSTGRTGDPRDEIVAAYYLPLEFRDAAVAEVSDSMYTALGIPNDPEGALRSRGSGMLAGSGLLNRWAQGAPQAPSAGYPPRTR